jgi:hypothetical protein
LVPPGLIDQWRSEIRKFAPSLTIVEIYDFATLQKKITVSAIVNADVVICPVDILECKGYLENLVFKAGLKRNTQEIPKLPFHTGQLEVTSAWGVWIPDSSQDPYGGAKNDNNQKRRNQSAYYTYVYQEAIQKVRATIFKESDTGIPLEYFEWERIFVDEM